jgi:hypothetical protein
VLIAGGSETDAKELATAAIYKPAEKRFETLTATMRMPRRGHLALLLEGNGAVLFAGGTSQGQPIGTSELFQPWDDTFVEAGALTLGRSSIAVAPLTGGEVLAMGGADGQSFCRNRLGHPLRGV